MIMVTVMMFFLRDRLDAQRDGRGQGAGQEKRSQNTSADKHSLLQFF
jgi:hypothetical protein